MTSVSHWQLTSATRQTTVGSGTALAGVATRSPGKLASRQTAQSCPCASLWKLGAIEAKTSSKSAAAAKVIRAREQLAGLVGSDRISQESTCKNTPAALKRQP